MNDVQRFGRIQVEMCDTFKSKNADYGNSFSQIYQEFGDNGIYESYQGYPRQGQ